jgi:hypothetical protein
MRLFQGLLFCPPEIVPAPWLDVCLDVCSFEILTFVCLFLNFMHETGARVAKENIFAPVFSVKEEEVFISDMHYSHCIPKIRSSLFLDDDHSFGDHLTYGRRISECLLPPPEPPPDPPQYQLLSDIYLIFICDTNMIIIIGFSNLIFGFGGSLDVAVRGLSHFYNAPAFFDEPQTQVSNFYSPVIFMIMVPDINGYYYGCDDVFTPVVSIFSYGEGREMMCILDAALVEGCGSGRMWKDVYF